MGTRSRIVGALVLLAVALWAGLFRDSGEGEEARGQEALGAAEAAGADSEYSNVRAHDYVGPAVCGDCHDERYQQWSGNLHRRMNRLANEPGAILGAFDGQRLAYGDGEVAFEERGDDFVMTFFRNGEVYREYRVTRTIGSRYLQEYVGVQTMGPDRVEHEVRLPFGFLLRRGVWLHQQYLDSWHGQEYGDDDQLAMSVYDPSTAPWRGRCAWCHNTYPFERRLARLKGDEQIGSGIELLFLDEGGDVSISENLLEVDSLVSVGISCESCHFGGREHAVNGKKIRFAPAGSGIAKNPQAPAIAGTRDDARTINAICAQCHSTPTALYPNGAGTRNSSEALDLLSGACASKIKCTHCHDPHVAGPGALAPDQPRHLAACVQCHANLADAELARDHSQHSSEVTCLDCHMPRIVQGVDELIRSHRISSPSDAEMLENSVNACNLCHLGESLQWTGEHLARTYGISLPAELRLTATPAAREWLASETRIVRLTAASALGYASPTLVARGEFLGDLLALLDAPLAYDRLRYLWALESVLGRDIANAQFTVTGPPSKRAIQLKALRARVLPAHVSPAP